MKVKKEEDAKHSSKVKISHRFVTALSIVSILGFLGIISQTLFNYDINHYIESLLMFIVGIGLVLEAKAKNLRSIASGLSNKNFTHLTTIIIGMVAIIAGVFSFPPIRIETPGFLAIKGIMAIIAVVVIVIQTWFVE